MSYGQGIRHCVVMFLTVGQHHHQSRMWCAARPLLTGKALVGWNFNFLQLPWSPVTDHLYFPWCLHSGEIWMANYCATVMVGELLLGQPDTFEFKDYIAVQTEEWKQVPQGWIHWFSTIFRTASKSPLEQVTVSHTKTTHSKLGNIWSALQLIACIHIHSTKIKQYM